jgi:hypothetical protein
MNLNSEEIMQVLLDIRALLQQEVDMLKEDRKIMKKRMKEHDVREKRRDEIETAFLADMNKRKERDEQAQKDKQQQAESKVGVGNYGIG